MCLSLHLVVHLLPSCLNVERELQPCIPVAHAEASSALRSALRKSGGGRHAEDKGRGGAAGAPWDLGHAEFDCLAVLVSLLAMQLVAVQGGQSSAQGMPGAPEKQGNGSQKRGREGKAKAAGPAKAVASRSFTLQVRAASGKSAANNQFSWHQTHIIVMGHDGLS